MTTFTDDTPMVTVHADHHNELAAAVDNLQGLVGNSVLSGTWRWTSSTTDASASGRVGLDQVTWVAATQLNLNETTQAGGDTANVLAKLKVGDGFYLQDHTDASRWARYTISGTPIDQGTWRQFPVTFVDGSEPTPANNSDTVVTLTVQGGAASSGVTPDKLMAGVTYGTSFNTALSLIVFVAPFPCTLAAASVINNTTTIAASDTIYWTVNIRIFRATTFRGIAASKTTRITGGEAMTFRGDWNFDAVTFDPTLKVLAKGDIVEFQFAPTGTAATIGQPLAQVRYEPT
jgi:hypothetical protein